MKTTRVSDLVARKKCVNVRRQRLLNEGLLIRGQSLGEQIVCKEVTTKSGNKIFRPHNPKSHRRFLHLLGELPINKQFENQ